MAEDLDLLQSWQGGDRRAGSALVERHYDAVARFFRTKAPAVADDLVQRTFLALAEALSRYSGAASVRAYVFGIARNVLLEHLRDKVRGRVDPDFGLSSIVDLDPGVLTQVALRAEQRLLVQCLQRLPVELQVALELAYWEGLSTEELATALAIPPGTVKSRLHRARRLLREAMDVVVASGDERSALGNAVETWLGPRDDVGA